MTIYKYPLQIADVQVVTLPSRAKILTIQMQGSALCLWAQVEEKAKTTKERTIEIFGTGHQMSMQFNRIYIGTVQQYGGSLVWHIFERDAMALAQ